MDKVQADNWQSSVAKQYKWQNVLRKQSAKKLVYCCNLWMVWLGVVDLAVQLQLLQASPADQLAKKDFKISKVGVHQNFAPWSRNILTRFRSDKRLLSGKTFIWNGLASIVFRGSGFAAIQVAATGSFEIENPTSRFCFKMKQEIKLFEVERESNSCSTVVEHMPSDQEIVGSDPVVVGLFSSSFFSYIPSQSVNS